MVTSTLLGHGTSPRFTIGSVNFTEFFVTATISATFLGTIGLELGRSSPGSFWVARWPRPSRLTPHTRSPTNH